MVGGIVSRLAGKDVLYFAIWGAFLLLSGRLLYMQVLDRELVERARKYVVRRVEVDPLRGEIYDREGRLLAGNQLAYDVYINPEVFPDSLVSLVGQLFNVDSVHLVSKIREGRRKGYMAVPVILGLPLSQIVAVHPLLAMLPGLEVRERFIRFYPQRCCAHILGYLSEVDSSDIEADPYYTPGDLKGVAGVEAYWEKLLRGKKGVRFVLVDPMGRVRGSYEGGVHDVSAQPGRAVVLTIDLDLQMLAERLLENKRGAVVMMDVRTGEVLALASSPSFVLDSLQGLARVRYFRRLLSDEGKPLLNRAISAIYPPGSTVKPLLAYVYLRSGVVRVDAGWVCPGEYVSAGISVGCHIHPVIYDVSDAIAYSCNGFFCWSFVRAIGVRGVKERFMKWRGEVLKFGVGSKTGIELPGERSGWLPDTAYYNKGYDGFWNAYTVISLGIGQGEWLVTPLQLAYMTALIATCGRTPPPVVTREPSISRKVEVRDFDCELMEVVRKGMEEVVRKGTARRFKIPGLCWAGKTGTAENPHGKDHSLFVGYAPCEGPEVSVAVVIEHGGFGATIAAPVAALLIAAYFKGGIPPEMKWLEEYVLNFSPEES